MSYQFDPQSPADFAYSHPSSRELMEDFVNGFPILTPYKFGLLFHGPSGTGKSSLAAAMAKFIEDSPHVAADPDRLTFLQSTGMSIYGCGPSMAYGSVFQSIKNSTNYSYKKGYRYVLLDEVDTMPAQAVAGLKALMGPAGPRNVIFLLTTNDKNRLSEPLVSRLHNVPMYQAPASEFVRVGQNILASLGMPRNFISPAKLQSYSAVALQDFRHFVTQIEHEVFKAKKGLAPHVVNLAGPLGQSGAAAPAPPPVRSAPVPPVIVPPKPGKNNP